MHRFEFRELCEQRGDLNPLFDGGALGLRDPHHAPRFFAAPRALHPGLLAGFRTQRHAESFSYLQQRVELGRAQTCARFGETKTHALRGRGWLARLCFGTFGLGLVSICGLLTADLVGRLGCGGRCAGVTRFRFSSARAAFVALGSCFRFRDFAATDLGLLLSLGLFLRSRLVSLL